MLPVGRGSSPGLAGPEVPVLRGGRMLQASLDGRGPRLAELSLAGVRAELSLAG